MPADRRLRKRLVIIGGGFGGLYTAKQLSHSNFEITLVDKTNHHLFQPLLYQVATAALSSEDIGTPIRKIFSQRDNILTLMSRVTKIDKVNREIHLHNHEPIEYDILVVATGVRHSYFGNDQWEQYAPGLKTLDDALTIRDKLLFNFEKAELCDRYSDAQKYLSFIIVGGGPTGVELAGAVAEIANHTMRENFRRINPASTRVYLIEAANRILPALDEKLSAKATKDLEHLGVEVITSHAVTDITPYGVQVGDRFIKATNTMWAAGTEASTLLKTLDVPLDRVGRVIVEPDLTMPSYPEVFVIGDAAHCKGKDGEPLPAVAQVAMQQAKYVSQIIKKGKIGKNAKPFSYLDLGAMATIGHNRAVAEVGGFHFSGFFAWCLWSVVHLMNLVLYRNRLKVLGDWVQGYLTGHRGARLIRNSSEEDFREELKQDK
ncbi:NADH dehydrogenase [hydrothermal vent metagenome]|uniref:NADH:ubiquinone reductase (non-electrogenic) n=1 Tax=hydrothermal vent metagenome TaxID=652676 RepID=A0A3B1BVU5_9ZZZZ